MTVRIAMWSGPRNISTAMMRAFENRRDCTVADEPFYAAYLAATGLDHPMRAEVLGSQPTDPAVVVAGLNTTAATPIVYEKHMTHHMLEGMDLGFMALRRNAFLIRDPAAVLASYVVKRGEVTLEDIGVVRQHELFDREAQRLGHAPPVIEGRTILEDPRAGLTLLCGALDIPFTERMLSWPQGRRPTDGVWAPAWYDAVEKSVGFGSPPPPESSKPLPDGLRAIADAARPHYEVLKSFALG